MGFYLVGPGTTRYVYLSYTAKDGQMAISVGMKVSEAAFMAGKLPKDERSHLNRIQLAIDDYEADCRLGGKFTCADELKGRIYKLIGRKGHIRRKSTMPAADFVTFFREYLQDVESGAILNNGKAYSASYITNAHMVLRSHLYGSPLDGVAPEVITEEHLSKFAAYLTKKGFAKNTVATYMAPVVFFLSNGRRKRKHTGPLLDPKGFRISWEDIDHGVYLTEEQQQIALNHKYKRLKDAHMRDIYILGCQLGMRYVDLAKLKPHHRVGDKVNINTTKTTTQVWVPLNKLGRQIWDNYAGVFTIPEKSVLRNFAKRLGRDCGFNKQILFVRTQGGVTIEKYVPMWSLMGTHTMRRSLASNAYKAGVPMLSIMKVTGHRSTGSFMRYVRLNQ